MSHSRHGAMICTFGAMALYASSNLTWSLPLPVQPCESPSAPSCNASSAWRFAITYLLGTSMARPVIAKRQAELALQLGGHWLSHGCTGKGNDHVRFEMAYQAIAPNVQII